MGVTNQTSQYKDFLSYVNIVQLFLKNNSIDKNNVVTLLSIYSTIQLGIYIAK